MDNPLAEITELALLTFRDTDFKRMNYFSTYIKIKSQVPKRITELTGISDNDLIGAMSIESALSVLYNALPMCSKVVGHIDHPFLLRYWTKLKINPMWNLIDTWELAKQKLPNIKLMGDYQPDGRENKPYSLYNLCQVLEIKQSPAHRAMGDSQSCFEVYKKLVRL